ncbi:MAG: low-specificity L-threonine aldolase [Gemmataceae bacterium]|nr:low-specificity L-threonine aldolase [Gemmataceae bacterium]
MDWIDLRSDTVTRPTPGMRAAMLAAEVGDDVFQEDPTIKALEEKVASLLGKEAAVFCPSGTMSNQMSIRTHTQSADEIICEESCHIFNWEAGGPAALSGVSCRTLRGQDGVLEVHHVEGMVRPPNDHYPRTRVLCVENTHNRCGGKVQPFETLKSLRDWTKKNNLAFHLDGARLWNASIASGIPLDQWGGLFDSVSVCFSKGLGAPVGSALTGSKDFIHRARRFRKLFGGGMRQAGILAAAAIYALDNHFQRMVEDHENAQIFARAVRETPGLEIDHPTVETNIIWFRVDSAVVQVPQMVAAFKAEGVLIHTSGLNLMRAVTHLDVSKAQVAKAAGIVKKVVSGFTHGKKISSKVG